MEGIYIFFFKKNCEFWNFGFLTIFLILILFNISPYDTKSFQRHLL